MYLAWTSGGNRGREKHRSRWEWKIKMCRREIEWRGMDKIHMAKQQGQVSAAVNREMNYRFV